MENKLIGNQERSSANQRVSDPLTWRHIEERHLNISWLTKPLLLTVSKCTFICECKHTNVHVLRSHLCIHMTRRSPTRKSNHFHKQY
jgi:hypothetical protein